MKINTYFMNINMNIKVTNKKERALIMILNNYPDILTIDEVMEILLIGRSQCYELLSSGKLKSFKVGKKTYKIPKEAVIEFIRNEHQ